VAEDLQNIKLLRFDGLSCRGHRSGRGLGGEFARLLAQRGAAVVGNDIGRSEDDQYAESGMPRLTMPRIVWSRRSNRQADRRSQSPPMCPIWHRAKGS